MVEIAAEMAEESPKPRFSVTEVAQEDPAVFQEAAEEVNDKFLWGVSHKQFLNYS